jgi:hypothetical protein
VVSERELEALFARGLHPSAGTRLGRARRADGVTGFDLTFSAPKSVSALWALGDSPNRPLRRARSPIAARPAGRGDGVLARARARGRAEGGATMAAHSRWSLHSASWPEGRGVRTCR